VKKELIEDTQMETPSMFMGQQNILKMTILPKAIYKSSPHENVNDISSQKWKKILKFIWKHKENKLPKQPGGKRAMMDISQNLPSNHARKP
jgi:hypothetical protein